MKDGKEGKAMVCKNVCKSALLTVSLIVCLASTGWTQDPNHIAIIINPSNPIDHLSGQELRQIFLAEQQRWPNGDIIKVIMRSPGQPERATVLAHVYEMHEREFSRYFLKAVFTGTVQAAPKRFTTTAAGVRQFVARVPGAVGYVRSSDVDSSVKIVRIDNRLPGEPRLRAGTALEDTMAILRLKNLSIGKKLGLLSGLLLITVCMVGLVGYRGILQLQEASQSIQVNLGATRNVMQAHMALDRLRSLVLLAALETGKTAAASEEASEEAWLAFPEVSGDFQTSLREIEQLAVQETVKEAVAMMRPTADLYIAEAEAVISLVRAGQHDQISARLSQFQTGFAQLVAGMALLGDLVEAEANQTRARGDQAGISASRTTLSVMLVAVLLATMVGLVVTRSITNPLSRTVQVLEAVAQGDFTQCLNLDSQDEVGRMARALDQAVTRMRNALHEIRGVASRTAAAATELSVASERLSAGTQHHTGVGRDSGVLGRNDRNRQTECL